MNWNSFSLLPQTYEVAARAQNTERVKLVTFEGSLGYLHNGLYRDPRLPEVVKWENITLIVLVVITPNLLHFHNMCTVFPRVSSTGGLCSLCNAGKTSEAERPRHTSHGDHWFNELLYLFCKKKVIYWNILMNSEHCKLNEFKVFNELKEFLKLL